MTHTEILNKGYKSFAFAENTIQQKLINLPGDSIFAIAVRAGAKENNASTIQMIKDQYFDNPGLVEKIIGKELINKILCLKY